ncbi:MAG: transglutaminase domain-containing protein [Candidatus Poseidoniaceae archaeon]|jgi:transglutaminase-like putative cysteine protease|nr:transglutaminase domain-containing protein [Candidatus Poseidoniaceae archaeon]
MQSNPSAARPILLREIDKKKISSLALSVLMLLSTLASIEFVSFNALAATDQDGDGLTYGLEYLMNTQPNDWDSDNDQLPDGWEWQYGLDPLSSSNDDGAIGDPDGDGFSNLQEYTYKSPQNWDLSSTPSVLDNGVWWNGTVPVNNWDEENAMQYNQPGCGDSGSDGTGNTILCDEDPMGNICTDGLDNDKDGMVDSGDNDGDGDADCLSDDDDGDGLIDEDPMGWDTDGDGMPDGWEASNSLDATSPSGADGKDGDPDGDGLINLYEYVNPSWTTTCGGQPCYEPGPDGSFTETVSPCDPVTGAGPGGCLTLTAETDSITSTNPNDADTDNDGLNDSYEALTLLTDPTNPDTDSDGIDDGVEVTGQYGNPPQASDPRSNNTDGDEFDDGQEDKNGNGLIDANETDPTRREDSGDFDNDGLENWQENLSCSLWNVADSDFGGVNDGDESNVTHGTDPCDSMIDYSTSIVSYNSGTNQLTVLDGSGFSSAGGVGYYNNSGTLTSFTYATVLNDVLQGVPNGPGAASIAMNRNGSWCHDASGGPFANYCDDDYSDSDGDGLADWEETLGVYGFFSNPTLVDSDGDGVTDYDEVMSSTDPLEPCDNLLDSDGDALNDYFEVSTGCDNAWIGITNGSQDIWSTSENDTDTDGGGVSDKQEYFDSTNPESNASDDVLPDDFDGDGIPDIIENMTGTDWRNPDTDGGGLMDGEECPELFWFVQCAGAPFNPWDPSDDLTPNEIIFWANNTSGVVDENKIHYWRLNTFDYYTGAAYGLATGVHTEEEVTIPYTNLTHLASSNYANDTVSWMISYNLPIMTPGSKIPLPAYQYNITLWQDANSQISRTNDTHTWELITGSLDNFWVEQHEYWFDWSTLSANTIAGTNSSYSIILPDLYNNVSEPTSLVSNVTNEVINSAGATDAYSKAEAIATFLREGNATIDFKRNYNGSNSDPSDDLVYQFLDILHEGTCAEFTTVFVTMARTAGLPARYVNGYASGNWNGNGYDVFGEHYSTWGEVRLEMSQGSGGDDLGWIPFDACPPPEEVEIVNLTWTPTTYDRNGSTEVIVSGVLRYVENSTVIPDISLFGHMVSVADVVNVPGSAGGGEYLFGTATTDANGTFTMNGTVGTPSLPGYAAIMIEHMESGYVSHDAIDVGVFVNITDDSNITHESPSAIDAPVLGAGATTVISGKLLFENNETEGSEKLGNLTVWLDFTSSVTGSTNLTGVVGSGGYWEINVTLDELESKGNISATIGFDGWQDTSQSVGGPLYHLRPSTHNITMDVRDAPNLTATIEGPGLNNSILQVGQMVYINGSAMSFGLSPTQLSGNLSFGMRELNGGGTFVELFNVSVTGSFQISQQLISNITRVKAGEIELSLTFYPDALNATDSLNTSGTEWWLEGLLFFELQATPQLRGNPAAVVVQVTDHLGSMFDLILNGTFSFDFDGSQVNQTIDPSTSTLSPTFSTNSNLLAGDYQFDMAFGGNRWYQVSSGTSLLRIQGNIDVALTIVDDWTHLGNTTWIVGSITDAVHNTAVLNNDSVIIATLVTEQGFFDVGTTMLNNTTGTFNITITAPTTLPSSVYTIEVLADFNAMAPEGGTYWEWVDTAVPPALPNIPSVTWGIESEVKLRPSWIELETTSDLVAEINSTVDLPVFVSDIADESNVSGSSVDYIFDYGGANLSIGTSISGADGNTTFQWLVSGVDPGLYVMRMEIQDDVTDPKTAGSTRHLGNYTEINITIQAPSNIRVDSIPSVITAGVNFQVIGQIEDGDNQSRPLVSAVALEMFWEDNPDEILINGVFTSTNGSFNLSVPTDILNNGTVRGPRIFVITVVEDSSPFYISDISNHSIQVMGVTTFEGMQPLNPIIVNRGEGVNLSLQMVESSNMWQALGNYTIDVLFDETWLNSNTTDENGRANFSHTIPFDQPLGLITVSYLFNGSIDLLSCQRNLSTITVRSTTILVVNSISANPVAGESFNVNGTIESDNGSSLEIRNGNPLQANILFTIDGLATGFQLSNGSVQPDGTWTAIITLDSSFPAGTHVAEASYIPSVNYYSGSQANQSFDSKGFTTLTFLDPVFDGAGQPSLNDRVDRGDDIDIRLLLIDNTGSPVSGVQVSVVLNGTIVTGTGSTDSNGFANISLTSPSDLIPGFHDLSANFSGTPGTTGLVGDDAEMKFVVLAETIMTILEHSTSIVAGDTLYVNGTLLDDLGLPLQENGENSGAVIYLHVDGVPIASVESNATTGQFGFAWTSPSSISAGPHDIQVEFTGGRDWVDPIGIGDSSNPDFYHPSSDVSNFSVAVPTKILLLTSGGEVNREDVLTIQGRLLDLVDNPLEGETIQIYLGGILITNVTTSADGGFTAVHTMPADATLGPLVMEASFPGTQYYLPSNDSGTWNIYSRIYVEVHIPEQLAVADNTVIDGFVGDNQLSPLSGMTVFITVEGIQIGNGTTDENGNFTINWTVPNIFTDGTHTVVASVPTQGWYRAGQGNTTFFLAHRTGIDVNIVDFDVTRDDFWEISGTLYDLDTANNDGLSSETIYIFLDGQQVGYAQTDITGAWSASIRAESTYARGLHNLTFKFDGSSGHLPVEDTKTVRVWADVIITINQISTEVVRSDGINYPIVITGRVSEVGGQEISIDNAILSLGEGPYCSQTGSDYRCIVASSILWNSGEFTMTAIAPSWLEPGAISLNVHTPENTSLFLRASDIWTDEIPITIDASIDVEVEPIVEDKQEVVMGEIIVSAKDTGLGVANIAFEVFIEHENETILANKRIVTNEDGVAVFEFNSDPPYGDTSTWGELTIIITTSSGGILSDTSVTNFNAEYSVGTELSYSYNDEGSGVPWWMYALVVIVAGALAAFVILRRRAAEAAKELADIFSYTAELLAAGDAMREAIFNCYESLVHVLMQRGFLRRDFETVREFEMAIRQALPQISEESLTALDSVFEEARYSRHEMNESHKVNAQRALTRVADEITQMPEIPNR